MSRSIRICSYLLLPLIYLLVNVKIAQLGESFPITIVTFLPVLLLLYVDKINQSIILKNNRQKSKLEERLEMFYGKPIEEISPINSQEVDWGSPRGREFW